MVTELDIVHVKAIARFLVINRATNEVMHSARFITGAQAFRNDYLEERGYFGTARSNGRA